MADHRHKRDANARRKPRAALVAAPVALLATVGAVTLGVAATPSSAELVAATAREASTPSPSIDTQFERQPVVSRSSDRIERKPTKVERITAAPAVRRAVAQADTRKWTTTTLNLWDAPGEAADNVGQVDALEKVLVTGRTLFGREEIVVDGTARWVSRGYLVAEKPETEEAETEAGSEEAATEPQLGAACTNGTSVASGVSPNVVKVHEAVCAAFPEISTYGTFRGDGEHSQGLAVDIMVSGDRGWEVAEFVRANHAALGVSYLIYAQKIWSVERAGEGWRSMEDRGSTTANHYDHVHVTTY
ncbi:mucin-2 protein [Nocardioides marmotae]|uniref:mucin-2 protein n=1 Tax=Nocardioides marmotae TaxID=2663857 RepID=UPI0012B60686|nr:mucin-2 protein [Nocardioides marmotae]MBC9735399.1 mucin-2 protein [Nocardioides marmotae]MTB86496.1 mucin-2 protein [Nocardioides marmotae]